MQFVPSTLIALIVCGVLIWRGPYKGMALFWAMTPLGAAAAFNLPAAGGASILLLDLATLTLFALLCLTPYGMARIAGAMRPFQPGFWLLLLLVYSIVATLFFPRLFAGQTEVFSLSRSANDGGIISVPLRPTNGNLTQLFRILLGGMAFYAMAVLFRMRPSADLALKAVGTATVVHVGMGWLDLLTGMTGTTFLLEPLRSANYAMLFEHRMMGIKRMVGGFPEASSFGYFSLGLFGFWLLYWINGTHSKRAGFALIMTGVVLLRSTSSSAYVALVVFLMTLALWHMVAGLKPNVPRRAATALIFGIMGAWFAAIAIFAAYHMVEPVTAYLDRTLFDKLDSQSGVERMSWNTQAWKNFLDTGMLGAGLGSVRASNWLLAVMASLGVIGTALWAFFLGATMRLPRRTDDPRRDAVIKGLKAGGLAMLVSGMLTLATPDLGITFFLMAGMAAGLSRGGVLVRYGHSDPVD
ncbi:hypothetical protein ACX9MO_17100 [Pseudooceanicola sp. 502str34]|uniref:hypothetical protein n=1 Tax=Maritimibacter alkaliphilus TaxID=404236 RepID=UPI001C95531E|nr:hypothetical protein [Maritimibacter alkaliphilus]MBY6089572.1 hypothetical protein [Maritimibacter alkaliphilus]